MFCSFCGKQIRDEARFCSNCGKNLVSGQMRQGVTAVAQDPIDYLKNKKIMIPVCSIIVAIVLLITIISFAKFNSIVGVWMSGTSKVEFTKDGDYKKGANYGTYTITSDKTLIIEYGHYSYYSGTDTYKWGPEAKEDSDYWYISGDVLYFRGSEYEKM